MHTAHAEDLYYFTAHDALEAAATHTDPFRKAERVCTAMVFSALTLEAYINRQYASLKETKKIDLTKKELESLPLRDKWSKLPSLLGRAETFDEEAEPFRTFKALIKLRNDCLVHFKPGKPAEELRFSNVVKDLDLASHYFACIGPMIEKLRDLTRGETESPTFARNLSTDTISFPGIASTLTMGCPTLRSD